MIFTPSDFSNLIFSLTPLEYPPMAPSFLTTLWQGIVTGLSFLLKTLPTARAAPGQPILPAISEYEQTKPRGIFDTSLRTAK